MREGYGTIKRGDRFRYRLKYGVKDEFYFGIVDQVLYGLSKEYTSFYADNGIIYKSTEVEWLDERRDSLLTELGI